jgi:hypothetical protein
MGPDVPVLAECTQLTTDFASVSYVYCCREANQVADSLAKHSFKTRLSEFSDYNIPDFILLHIVNDMAVI